MEGRWCGVEWRRDGGRANSPRLVVPRVRSCSSSPVSVHARRRPCPFMGTGRRSWPVVVRARRGSWGMVKGAGGRRRLCAVVVVVVACVPSWALGISCGRWRLIVVILGWGGGRFRAVVVVFCGRSASSWSNESLGRVLACDVACHFVVVVVGGGCEQMAMVVGGGGC